MPDTGCPRSGAGDSATIIGIMTETTRPVAPSGGGWRMAKLTSPMARAMAGHRMIPLWAVVHHRGRKTGRALSVPVAVRLTQDGFLINLPWGPGTNWVRNVLVAGGCTIRWKGEDHRVTQPRLVGPGEARPYFGRITWGVAQRMFAAEHFLVLRHVA